MARAQKPERSYGLSQDEVKSLKAEFEETKRMPNPYQKGAYRFTVEALLSLGAGEFHPLPKVQDAFKDAAGAEWYDAWAKKEARSDSGKDADARFVQNLRVLQRTADYGKRLLDVGRRVLRSKGAVIDLDRDDAGMLLVRLNLDSSRPQKPGRRPLAGNAATRSNAKAPKGGRSVPERQGKVKRSGGVPKARRAEKRT